VDTAGSACTTWQRGPGMARLRSTVAGVQKQAMLVDVISQSGTGTALPPDTGCNGSGRVALPLVGA